MAIFFFVGMESAVVQTADIEETATMEGELQVATEGSTCGVPAPPLISPGELKTHSVNA